jgi:hypothetical protein
LGLEFSDTDEANGDVATRSAELFVGLGPVESLRTSRDRDHCRRPLLIGDRDGDARSTFDRHGRKGLAD